MPCAGMPVPYPREPISSAPGPPPSEVDWAAIDTLLAGGAMRNAWPQGVVGKLVTDEHSLFGSRAVPLPCSDCGTCFKGVNKQGKFDGGLIAK